MPLQEGDFFEGVYQLKKEIVKGASEEASRWLADDFTGSQKNQVVIDIIPQEYDAKLNWVAEVNGVLRVGQSVSTGSRYVVWNKNKAKTLSRVTASEIDEEEKEKFVKNIEALDLAANESVNTTDIPEFWHTDDKQVLFFYRKQVSTHANPRQNAEVLHFWKKIIHPDYVSSPKSPDPSVPGSDGTPKKPEGFKALFSSARWTSMLVVIGILLAIAVYFLRPDSEEQDSKSRAAFNKAIEAGVAFEKKGEYERAVEAFKNATQLPPSDAAQQVLDSLSYVYESYAFMECQKYKSTDSSNLFFIADQYFHYAGILTRTTPIRKCE